MSEGNAQAASPLSETRGEQVQIDEQQQKRIQKYMRAVALILLVPMIIGTLLCIPVILLVITPIVSGVIASPWLTLQPEPGWYPLRILVLYLLGVAIIGVFLFPFSLFSGHILPQRYNISTRTHTFSAWMKRWIRINGRRLLVWLSILECCVLYIAVQPEFWWLWMAFLLTLIAVMRTYLTPLYAFRKAKRKPLTDELLMIYEPLANMLNKLCETHKTHIQNFFVLATNQPDQQTRANAYLAGWGKTSSILLTDSLLKNFQYAEIRVVVAHELGHHVHRDLIKRQLLNFGLLLAEFFLISVFYHWFLSLASFASNSSGSLVLAFFALGYLILCLRFFFWLARRRYRQRCEFWADEFALCATCDVQAFKNAMLRLGNLNNLPFKLTPRQEKSLTHPTTMSRWQHADEFAVRLARARAANRQG